jgi:hypothetical protein
MRNLDNPNIEPKVRFAETFNDILNSYCKIATRAIATGVILFALPSFASPPKNASAQADSSTVSVTTVVTVLSANHRSAPPPIAKGDVNVTEGKARLNVIGWEPAQAGGRGQVQFAILIDNALRTTVIGRQMDDLRKFITSLPPSTSVGVFYAMNGSAEPAAPFSTDHQSVANKVRLTMGRSGGDSPSIFLSLGDLIKRWQPIPGGRREVLLLSSGNDALDPSSEDPYFDSALHDAQTAGIVVHAIYDGTDRYGLTFRGGISQGKLAQITKQTGGEGFFDAAGAPISLSPHLNDLNNILANQYLLTLAITPGKSNKGDLRSINIRLEQRDVKVSYPGKIFVPGR